MIDPTEITILGIPLVELMEDPLFMAIIRSHQGKRGIDAELWSVMKDYLCDRCEVKLLKQVS